MTPVLYYVYRLAATHQILHVEDLLSAYENGNELDGWIEYFKEEDVRLQKMLKTALSGARVAQAPVAPARPKPVVEEPVMDMTDPKIQQDFLKFVTGAK